MKNNAGLATQRDFADVNPVQSSVSNVSFYTSVEEFQSTDFFFKAGNYQIVFPFFVFNPEKNFTELKNALNGIFEKFQGGESFFKIFVFQDQAAKFESFSEEISEFFRHARNDFNIEFFTAQPRNVFSFAENQFTEFAGSESNFSFGFTGGDQFAFAMFKSNQ